MPIELSTVAIRNLLFGWPEYWGEPHQSVLVRNEPLGYYPKHVPLEYADVLLRHDPDSTVFTIFKYAHHAEVWHTKQWLESYSHCVVVNAKRAEQEKDYFAKLNTERTEFEKFRRVKEQILAIMPALDHGDPAALIQLVRALLKAPRELTDKFEGLTAIIHPPTDEAINTNRLDT